MFQLVLKHVMARAITKLSLIFRVHYSDTSCTGTVNPSARIYTKILYRKYRKSYHKWLQKHYKARIFTFV